MTSDLHTSAALGNLDKVIGAAKRARQLLDAWPRHEHSHLVGTGRSSQFAEERTVLGRLVREHVDAAHLDVQECLTHLWSARSVENAAVEESQRLGLAAEEALPRAAP